jgi:hypothetical protein
MSTQISYTTQPNITNLNLVTVQTSQKKEEQVVITPPVDHIVIIDCSGSMYSDLPKIRTQLKNKLSTLVKEDDTITLIWFSGKGQAGILKNKVSIKNLNDLQALHTAIDRFLQPMGLTGFVDPLKLVKDFAKDKSPNRVLSMLFVTDGYDNQSNKTDILNTINEISSIVDNAVFVEFGYYCNKPLMMEMAEKIGGQVIFSDSFESYDPLFEGYLKNNIKSSNKVKVVVYNPYLNLVYGIDNNGDLYTFVATDNKVYVSEDFTKLYYLSATNFPLLATKDDLNSTMQLHDENTNAILASINVFAQRNKPKVVYDLLKSLGDVKLIKSYVNAFGKQALYKFVDLTTQAIKDKTKRFEDGIDFNLVPDENAFCIIDLFAELADADVNWYPRHKLFKYKTIGAKKVQSKKLDTSTHNELLSIIDDMANNSVDSNKLTQMQDILAKLADKTFELVFKHSDDNPQASFKDAVWNEDRPNISFRALYHGTVDLPTNNFNVTSVDTFTYRNYTFIKDGIVNVEKFVVDLPYDLIAKYSKFDGLISITEDNLWLIDLTKLPVINRQMVKEVSAKELALKTYELLRGKACQRVVNFYAKELAPKTSATFIEQYGEAATNWLTELGITNFNGFAPKTTDEKVGETYNATELSVKIPGLSTLPKVDEVEAKVKAGTNLKIAEKLIAEGLTFYEMHKDKNLQVLKSLVTKQVRQAGTDIAKIKFAIILGQTWFKEFDSMDENQLIVDLDGTDVKVKFESVEKTIEI